MKKQQHDKLFKLGIESGIADLIGDFLRQYNPADRLEYARAFVIHAQNQLIGAEMLAEINSEVAKAVASKK